MARPSSTDEVTTRRVRLALFDFDEFAVTPALLSAYTSFIAAAEDLGGEIERSYSSVGIYRPMTQDELEKQLASLQTSWDYREKAYQRAVDQGADGLKDYEINSIVNFAEQEELPNPFAPIVEHDEV